MCDMRENLLINTKFVLKYLINRNREHHTDANTINIDFFDYTGQYIPFYELGYCSLMTFLQNIPDVLKVDFFTLEVTASDEKSDNQIAPAPHFPIPKVPPFQCCRSMPYQARDLPWIRTYNNMDARDSNNRIYRPIPIKSPDYESNNDCKTATSSPLLGPRTYGDGKYSSCDSLNNKQDSEIAAFENSSTFSNDFIDQDKASILKNSLDCEIISDQIQNEKHDDKQSGIISCISTESEENETIEWKEQTESVKFVNFNQNDESNETFECKDHTEPDKVGTTFAEHQNIESGRINESLSFASSSSAESEVNISPPPPYSEQDLAAGNDVLSDPDKFAKPSYYYDSSSSDEKVRETAMENLAIPFAFSDDEDPIQMLDSNFTNEKYGAKYETTPIESVMQTNSYYEIYISEVNSPYKFWFQMGDDNPNLVIEMERELEMYYNMNSASYTPQDHIKKGHLAKGYACAALYGSKWHRAEILEKPQGDTVKVFFVDYGTVDNVSINDVRYLLNSFCKTPKLCHRGTLDFIKPIQHRWTVETTSYFQSLIKDTILVAGVSEIDQKTNSVRLYLIDREDGKSEIKINYQLVREGHAFPEDPRTRFQIHFADAVPTFDALETGKFPSYDDVSISLERGYNVEQEFESTIIEDIDCFIPQHISDEEAFQRVETFKKEREKAKQLAAQRDASHFLEFFGSILKNPFLNGTMTSNFEEKSTNPFFNM